MAASNKFNRRYWLEVQVDDAGNVITVELPFTIEFDVTRNTFSSANVCQIRVYNLAPVTRNQIRFNISNYGTYRSVHLKAGYGQTLTTIFKGNISQAWSVREGVNFITQIESFDGGFAFANGVADILPPFSANTTHKNVMRAMIEKGLPHVKLGVIGAYDQALTRGNSFSGPTVDAINRNFANNGFFVDNEVANVLQTNEYILSPNVVRIDASSGLLATPVLEQTIIHMDMLFEPSLNIGHIVDLENSTADQSFNGPNKITAVKHRGMISETVAGSVITTAEFYHSKILVGVM